VTVPERPRLLLADDHAIVARGLFLLLKDCYDIVAIVGDGPALVEAAVEHRPDVIVADISMPGCDGLAAVRKIRAKGISSRVVMLTMYADPDLAREAIASGANGFVIKHAAGDELIRAIRVVCRGETYLTPLLPPTER
jgi:DNA-binding NarL/FixJ family response regulator